MNEVLSELGGEVVWTQIGASNLMDVAAGNGASLAASAEGRFGFPVFMPAFDAIATLVYVLSMLAESGLSLSALRQGLPEVHVVHELVVTPSDQKGAVMRWFIERARGEDVVLIDGVKLIDASGWTLIVPDTEEPLTHVFAEADDEAASVARARTAVEDVRTFLEEN